MSAAAAGPGARSTSRFGPDGRLCCVARDEVVAFDHDTGEFPGTVIDLDTLLGQALVFFS